MFVYIGELCRYLVNQPERPDEHGPQAAPGLRQRPAARRLGEAGRTASRVPGVLEFYGSTEGNVSMFNFDGKPGAIGRDPGLPAGACSTSAWCSSTWRAEAPVRGPDGLCIEAGRRRGRRMPRPDQAATRAREYVGYADKAASEKKMLHDVFEPGDAWFPPAT